jgi:hypothetical protein
MRAAEMNLGTFAEPFATGKHPGYVPTALEGIALSLNAIYKDKIKVVINGGALNPKGLASIIHDMVCLKPLQPKWHGC